MEKNSESKNSAKKTYACHMCYRTFNRLHRLQSHIRAHKKQNIIIAESFKNTPDEETLKATQNLESNNKYLFTKILPSAETVSQNDVVSNVVGESSFSSISAEKALALNVEKTASNTIDNIKKDNSTDSENLSREIPVRELNTNQNSEPVELFEGVEYEVVVETENSDNKIPSKDKQQNSKDKFKVTYDCTLCMMKFPSKCHFARHLLTHTAEKPYICKICGKAFAQIGYLSVHSRVHSANRKRRNYPKDDSDEPPKKRTGKRKEQSYQCDVCEKLFKNKCYLDRHSLSHSKEKPYVCRICNKGFTQIGNLNVHYKTHSNEKNCVCYICDKAFTHVSSLKVHMVTHSDQKPHRCEVCHKGFANPCFLKRHSLIHTKLKPYVCNVCDKGFAQSGNLNVHMLTHFKPKLFQCDVCKVTFVAQACFEKHCTQHVMDDILNQVVALENCSETDTTLTQERDTRYKLITSFKASPSCSGETKSEEVNQRDSSLLVKSPTFRAKARKSIRIQSIYSLTNAKKQCSSLV